MKYSIVTFGCRVNQADSFQIEEQLLAAGGAPSNPHDADLIVVNTCSVTGSADQGTRQIVRKIARENPGARIVVTGCYATRRPDEVADLPGVVQIVPNDRKDRLTDEIGLTTAVRFGDGDGACGAQIAPGLAGRTAFTLRVQTGCDQTCSYCIIPTTRGAGRSRPVREVLAEIDRVGNAGYREIAITGVHLGSYGRDLGDGSTLLDLLKTLERHAAGIRFRISSLEPMDCSDEIVDLVARSECFAPHFHLPLQHASDAVLVAMRRPYTLAYYRRLVDRIRAAMPHASIGTDIIVGFPGETDADFAVLEAYLRQSPITHVHVFPYSDRPGTSAAELTGRVHGSIVRDRASVVRAIGRELNERFHRKQHGSVRPGLTIEDGSLVVTDNYLKVRIPAGLSRNEWVNVLLSLTAGNTLIGTLTEALPPSVR
ncbi:MAG TPA: tRNA (N(6)-L-threonylcarbamoyladenosine(37)-C(2))-methylthiotransferase MtaB [Vicinamibacterales bacterium]|nr:tRNA (N(6)-L-threonylcarbamoyladenosine(37)-C(2))-methylthiotransferase MtaB [Vicinamibacterales bacterium]